MKTVKLRQTYTFSDVSLVPQYSEVISRTKEGLSPNVATRLTKQLNMTIPILSANMATVTETSMALAMAELGGVGVLHRFQTITENVKLLNAVNGFKQLHELVGASIGATGDYLDRASALLNAGVDFLVLDVAHSDHKLAHDAIKALHLNFGNDLELIVGNISTYSAAIDLCELGVSALKVGQGPGANCSTRIVSGCGVPQLTAILDVVRAANIYKTPVIADGGIKTSGDIVKALAAGASSVMLGSLLAGTDEAPGNVINVKGGLYKRHYGSASYANGNTKGNAEGVEALVSYKGPVAKVINQLVTGIKIGLSYNGAMTIPELQKKAEFVLVSQAGQYESRPNILS